MNIFEKFLYFLQGEMERPKPYGFFHLCWVFLIIVCIIILYKRRDKHSEKELKLILGIYGITAFILELLKQLIWAFNYDASAGLVTWKYTWYSAPFQLCTTPIYVSLICLFLKKGKLRDSLLSYLAFVTILGSISTVIIPDSCFVRDILVNIHTMFLHCMSLVVSIYLIMSGEVKLTLKNLIRAILVFLVFVLIADLLNIVIYNLGILNKETFNMFYISPYFESVLPVFKDLWHILPYPIYLLVYILVISLGAFVIFGISYLIRKCICKK